MNITLKRRDICDLMMACTVCETMAMDGGGKWRELHDKLKAELDRYDEQMLEMRAAFGEGETIVNVLTGERFYT